MPAMLVAPGIGTAVLPWWPEGIDATPSGQAWAEYARPGRAPLLLPEGQTLEELRIDYVARQRDVWASVEDHLAVLRAIRASSAIVVVMLEQTNRGLWHMTDLQIAEVRHNALGQVAAAEVGITIKQASDATVNVGPIPRVTRTMPAAKKKRNRKK